MKSEIQGIISKYNPFFISKIKGEIYSKEIKGNSFYFAITGIGKFNVLDFLQKNKDFIERADLIISIGYCGTGEPKLNIGSLTLSKNIYELIRDKDNKIASIKSIGKELEVNDTALKHIIEKLNNLNKIVKVSSASSTLIVTGKEKKILCDKYGIQSVDMESYYIVSSCIKMKKPVLTIRAVSDGAYTIIPKIKYLLFPWKKNIIKSIKVFFTHPLQVIFTLNFYLNIKKAQKSIESILNFIILEIEKI